MEQTVESNTGLNTDIQSSEVRFRDLYRMDILKELEETQKVVEETQKIAEERKRQLALGESAPYFYRVIDFSVPSFWESMKGRVPVHLLEDPYYYDFLERKKRLLGYRTDGTLVDEAPDEPPNRKRKLNRNGMYTQEYVEGPKHSQESGLWGRFVGTTRNLANMCKSVPKDITSALFEKCGESMDTVISTLMNIMREGGKIPGKLAEIMKNAENTHLSDKLLGRFAGLIGNGWELLGFELGLTSVDIDHVKADRRENTMMAIYAMLRKWLTSKHEEAKASDLLQAMWNCKKVNVTWSELATLFL